MNRRQTSVLGLTSIEQAMLAWTSSKAYNDACEAFDGVLKTTIAAGEFVALCDFYRAQVRLYLEDFYGRPIEEMCIHIFNNISMIAYTRPLAFVTVVTQGSANGEKLSAAMLVSNMNDGRLTTVTTLGR